MTNKTFDAIPDELWLDVAGYENHYIVSNLGRVVSLKQPVRRLLRFGRKESYPTVNLLKNAKQVTVCVHRLVAEAFLLNSDNLKTVNHKDGNKENNRVENLEWASYSQNNQHAYDTGLKKQAVSVIAKPTNGVIGFWFQTQSQAAKHFGLKYASGIAKACIGQLKQHQGFRWEVTAVNSVTH